MRKSSLAAVHGLFRTMGSECCPLRQMTGCVFLWM